MIEFKRNGPFEKELFEEERSCVKIVGIGSAGVNALDQMVLDHHELGNLVCIDTDQQALSGSVVEEKILIGGRSVRGLGTGGDPEWAKRLLEDHVEEVRKAIVGAQFGIVVTGLGGGTGDGVTEEVLDLFREIGAETVVLGVSPMICEGPRKTKQAREAAARLRKRADACLIFSNERFLQIPEVQEDIRRGFQMMNGLVGLTCKSLVSLLSRNGLVQLDFSDIQSLAGKCAALGRQLENCWVGVGVSNGRERVREAVEQALSSPLFDGTPAWEVGDRALAFVEGGDDLSVGEFQELMEQLKQDLPSGLEIMAGAAVSPSLEGALSLTLFVARSGEAEVVTEELEELKEEEAPEAEEELARVDEEEESVEENEEFAGEEEAAEEEEEAEVLAHPKKREAKKQRYFAEQVELPLTSSVLRGRFEKSDPTIFNGQNLDQPTFLRLGIKVRL